MLKVFGFRIFSQQRNNVSHYSIIETMFPRIVQSIHMFWDSLPADSLAEVAWHNRAIPKRAKKMRRNIVFMMK